MFDGVEERERDAWQQIVEELKREERKTLRQTD